MRDVSERASQEGGCGEGAEQLRRPVAGGLPPREVPAECERERDGGATVYERFTRRFRAVYRNEPTMSLIEMRP